MPVKGQGRWLHQLIGEMEKVYRVSGDTNFNLIIVDFNSTDIDVEKTLRNAHLPRCQAPSKVWHDSVHCVRCECVLSDVSILCQLPVHQAERKLSEDHRPAGRLRQRQSEIGQRQADAWRMCTMRRFTPAFVISHQDKHSIIFICDLHYAFPESFIDTVRKHTIEGRMAFAPVIMRLHCGATPEDARGNKNTPLLLFYVCRLHL